LELNVNYIDSIIKQKPDIRVFLPLPNIILRDDIIDFDRDTAGEEESKASNDSYIKSNTKSLDVNDSTKKSFIKQETDSNTFNYNQTKSLENPTENKRISRVKNSPLIISAENIINFKNQNSSNDNYININNTNILNIHNNGLQEFENQNIINQSSFFNKSNYSQDLKNFQNEYWEKRRSDPFKYNSNKNDNNYANSGSEKSNFFSNESLNNDLNPYFIQAPLPQPYNHKENVYRSSEYDMKKAILERSKFEEIKTLNNKNIDKLRNERKTEFKKDVVVNRKKMDRIESAINKMVVEATHKTKDNMDLFMINSSNDEMICIHK